jgi:hypothetical protein
VKGQVWRPVGSRADASDANEFTVSVDREAAQIILRGAPTGPAGGASLTPVPGVELAFDRVGGWLSEAIVSIGQPGGPMEPAGAAAAYSDSLFGHGTAALAQAATDRRHAQLTIQAPPHVIGALSRLARLHAARRTSPEPASPLWAAEAAELSRQAGLPGQLCSAERGRLRGEGVHRDWPVTVTSRDEPHLGVPSWQRHDRRLDPMGGWLDLGLVPVGVFRPGLWPGTDLSIRAVRVGGPTAHATRIMVEAAILTGAPLDILVACRARLVDPQTRCVLSVAPFVPTQAGQARADLCMNDGWAGVHAEVVSDIRRPVYGVRLRRIRQALRWADAALRAESRPKGLAPELSGEQWIRLAELAWDRCHAEWSAVGDTVRANLAAVRGTRLGDAPDGTLAHLARPFLAELACGSLRDRRARPG